MIEIKAHSRLEALLQIWAAWMGYGRATTKGFPYKSSGFTELGVSSFQDIEDTGDNYAAKAIDAIIKGLPEMERSALHHCYLNSFYVDSWGRSYPIGGYGDALDNARNLVESVREKRGIW